MKWLLGHVRPGQGILGQITCLCDTYSQVLSSFHAPPPFCTFLNTEPYIENGLVSSEVPPKPASPAKMLPSPSDTVAITSQLGLMSFMFSWGSS